MYPWPVVDTYLSKFITDLHYKMLATAACFEAVIVITIYKLNKECLIEECQVHMLQGDGSNKATANSLSTDHLDLGFLPAAWLTTKELLHS